MADWHAKWRRMRETYFGSIWDIMEWLALAGIVLWAVAKAVGWINTPLIIELVPLILVAFSFGRFFQEQKEFRNEMREFKNETRMRLLKLESVKFRVRT